MLTAAASTAAIPTTASINVDAVADTTSRTTRLTLQAHLSNSLESMPHKAPESLLVAAVISTATTNLAWA